MTSNLENSAYYELVKHGHGMANTGTAKTGGGVPQEIKDYLWGMEDQLTAWRRDLHKIPELALEEAKTHDYLEKALIEMGYEPKTIGKSGTGIIVDIPGPDTSFTIGVRGDFDGLPITEVDDGRPYRSTHEGQMHACGHDAHATIVLGVARAYADGKVKPPCNVRLIFQPAEEGGSGAAELIEAGVLDGVDVIIGLHSDPTREVGMIGLISGFWSAWATLFKVEIEGKSAHGGAFVHLGKDAIVIASELVSQFQTIASRDIAAGDAGVVSVCTLNAGTGFAIVADKAVMTGTTRADSPETDALIKKRMTEIVKGMAIAYDTKINLSFPGEAPGVTNNPHIFELVRDTGIKVLGKERTDVYSRVNMGGEDFAWYTEEIPGFYYWLGIANNEKGINASVHTPEFDIDERALVVGLAMQLGNVKAIHTYHAEGGTF